MNESVTWCVYKHTNKHDGKVYIGRCRYPNYKARWANGNGYKESTRFWKDIEKYGWFAFEHEILFCNLGFEEANRIEQEMIAKYKATEPEHGYNISSGGVEFFKGQRHTEDAKKRISDSMKRYEMTETHKKHLSESKSGTNHHFAKPVYQLSKDGELLKKWDYMIQASEKLGINKANISSCCLGNRPSAGGYKWTYERV